MDDLLPILLTARGANWRKFQSRKSSRGFRRISSQVFKRDKNTCQYCGFQSDKYNHVVNKDQNYDNNKFDNFATSCSFCTQCFFLDSIGLSEDTGGTIIYLPEVSQADLNNFCRVLFCSMEKDSIYKNKLQSTYLTLKERSEAVAKTFGKSADEPKLFGRALIDSYLTDEQLDHHILYQLRLLPDKSVFKEQINYWKTTVFANIAF